MRIDRVNIIIALHLNSQIIRMTMSFSFSISFVWNERDFDSRLISKNVFPRIFRAKRYYFFTRFAYFCISATECRNRYLFAKFFKKLLFPAPFTIKFKRHKMYKKNNYSKTVSLLLSDSKEVECTEFCIKEPQKIFL